MSEPHFVSRVADFVWRQHTGLPGEFCFCDGGQVSLYASCFAALALQSIGHLVRLDATRRQAWVQYINAWQDAESGYFVGPELARAEFARPDLDETYVRLHLAVHVLPVLKLLGGRPAWPLAFARRFADQGYLRQWLAQRAWQEAWKEGNNLLFAGQLLVYLQEEEGCTAAADALALYFDWLDEQQDPATGLWGTDGQCDTYVALYGAYHQLLIYHYCGRPVHYTGRIIDTVLGLQQADGSFSQEPGGGACEDLDAIAVLVNLVQRTEGYRLAQVRAALGQALPHLLRQQTPAGGFVFRRGYSYMQGGVLRAFVPSDRADLFSTWFRLHSLALIDRVVEDARLQGVSWDFNHSCSMGWHDPALAVVRQPLAEPAGNENGTRTLSLGRGVGAVLDRALRQLSPALMAHGLRALLSRYLRLLAPAEGLQLLQGLAETVDRLGRERAYELGAGLAVPFWQSQAYRYLLGRIEPGEQVLHLGCGSGSLSYTLASQTGATVMATAGDEASVVAAARHYHHLRLRYLPPAAVTERAPPDVIVLTDFCEGEPAWQRWQGVLSAFPTARILLQWRPAPVAWQQVPLAPEVSAATAFAQATPAGWQVTELVWLWGMPFGELCPARLPDEEQQRGNGGRS